MVIIKYSVFKSYQLFNIVMDVTAVELPVDVLTKNSTSGGQKTFYENRVSTGRMSLRCQKVKMKVWRCSLFILF